MSAVSQGVARACAATWVSFALTVAAPALAQDTAHAEEASMDRIVVTASGFEQKIVEAPASISVVDAEELAKRPYMNLLDALRDMEGIDVALEAPDKNGAGTVSMRGMPSEYTLVLIDGRRQSNVGSLYPNNFGGGQFSYLPPLDAIERVEVVRGPMSTLYGSDAMGGVVNFITRKNTDSWRATFTTSGTFQEQSEFGDDRTADMYLAGPIVPGKLGFALRGSYYDRDESTPEWDPLPLPAPPNEPGSVFERSLGFGGGGKQVANTNWHGGATLTFTPNDSHDFILDIDRSRQKYDNTQGQSGTLDSIESLWRSGNATVANPDYDPSLPATGGNTPTIVRRVVQPRVGYTRYQRYERDQVALTHIGRWDIGTSTTSLTHSMSNNLGRSLPLTIAERAQLQTLWNDVCARRGEAAYCNNGMEGAGVASSNLTADEMARLNSFLPRRLRTMELEGITLDTKLEMSFGAHQTTVGGQFMDIDMEDGVFGMDGGGYRDGAVQTHRQLAIFAEDNWRLTDRLTATLGVRYDDHNIFGDQVSPRGYLVFSATDNWTFKGGVSTGYKAPRPDQLFPGITGFGGQGVSPIVGTPDLQPETSTNYELAAYFDNRAYSFNVTAFLNKFDDKIASGGTYPNCEVAAPGTGYCVDIGPGWAELGYRTFSQSINIDKAETRGIEVAGSVELPFSLTLRANYTLTESEQKSGAEEGRPISGNPAKHMANMSLVWRATDAISLTLNAEGRYDRYRDFNVLTQEERYYSDYTIFHLGASWEVSPRLTLNSRLNNLLDKDFISQTCTLTELQDSYECLDDYHVKDKRRSLWLSANLRF
jgi:outer membrane receptor for ferrienterochelin and colicins